MLLLFMIGTGALVTPPAKSLQYEQSAVIQRAKEEARDIKKTNSAS
jgi:hypothetical protein